MGCRIIGEQAQGDVWSIQGDVTLTLTPEASLFYVPQQGTLDNPPGYNNFVTFINNDGVDAANQTIAQDPSKNYGQQYDGPKCQRFMRLFTGNNQPYRNAEIAVRDGYVINYIEGNNYAPQGWLQYPIGLCRNYMEYGHQRSIDAVTGWMDTINWTTNITDSRRGQQYSREIAYSVFALVWLEKALGVGNTNLTKSGMDVPDRYPFMVTCMENHLWQWRNNIFTDPDTFEWMTPFMVAFTCMALAFYYDHNEEVRGNGNLHWPTGNWPTIPDAVQEVLAWMMDVAPVRDGPLAGTRIYQEGAAFNLPEGAGAFYYVDRETSGNGSPGNPAPDLNMIIAAPYAWVAQHYGGNAGRLWQTSRADKLFYGGSHILGSWISPSIKDNGLGMKAFNQQLYFMEEFFEWRNRL